MNIDEEVPDAKRVLGGEMTGSGWGAYLDKCREVEELQRQGARYKEADLQFAKLYAGEGNVDLRQPSLAKPHHENA